MTTLPENLVSPEPARLIPVIADSQRERRVASVFLATISAVPSLAEPLLSAIGVRVGKRSSIDTYTEINFKGDEASKNRPDGLIVLSTGKKTWTALIEAKIGSATLDDDQVQRYMQLARDNKIDAVVTLSNQFVSRATHSPVSIPKVLTRKVNLFHWSWKFILTEALLLQSKNLVLDPDQVFILREFTRFLSHDSVGVSGFEQMPAEWKTLVEQINSGAPVRKTSPECETVVAAWHQETRDLALKMSQHLATSIEIKLPRTHAQNSEDRLKSDCSKLSEQHKLQSEYIIPNAASELLIEADVKTKSIRVGMEIDAPQDKQRATARVNWLLRQLKHVTGENICVWLVWPSRAQDTPSTLEELREDPQKALAQSPLPPRRFRVFTVTTNSRRFTGRKTFIEDLEKAVPNFYDQVGQNLERWIPKPPKPVVDRAGFEKEETKPAESALERALDVRNSHSQTTPMALGIRETVAQKPTQIHTPPDPQKDQPDE